MVSHWRCSGPPTFIPALDLPQVAERRCGYNGSKRAVSVEFDSLRKEQLLEPLPLLECRGVVLAAHHLQVADSEKLK
jgi:hypothetical protein